MTGVALDQPAAVIAKTGTTQLSATVQPENAINKKVRWSSSDDSIATVEPGAEGLTATVTGKGVGEATITVTTDDGEHTADASITVKLAAPIVDITSDRSIKRLVFTWQDVAGATSYRLEESLDADSGFNEIATIDPGVERYSHEVPLFARVNARYILYSCEAMTVLVPLPALPTWSY